MEQAALADAREQGLVAKLQTATREIEALKRTANDLNALPDILNEVELSEAERNRGGTLQNLWPFL